MEVVAPKVGYVGWQRMTCRIHQARVGKGRCVPLVPARFERFRTWRGHASAR